MQVDLFPKPPRGDFATTRQVHVDAVATYGRARMYSEDLHALPIGTVVRDEADQAWTRIDDEDGGVWATPTGDDTMPSSYLAAKSAIYLAWVADK